MNFRAHPTAIIRFEPDGYEAGQSGLAGRQVAGRGFLRAAVAARGDGPVLGHTARKASADAFRDTVRALDADATPLWITPATLAQATAATPVLYTADTNLTFFAKWRLRLGVGLYSLCGVTHTISTVAAQRQIGELLSQPVMPWDALICTSAAARSVVDELLGAQGDYLRWRHGPDARIPAPQLPVIPLGVHCSDFAFSTRDRAAARQGLGLAQDEVTALYVGRLRSTNKAHPFQLFHALQAAARRTGRRTALILCGMAPSAAALQAIVDGAAAFAPDVRLMVVDGGDQAAVRGAWAAGDIFVSLADSTQETFGLTPLEAMAASLPVVASDWNGYRDTVRDGIDGFLVPTWAPQSGAVGVEIAALAETHQMSPDNYAWAAASMTALDHGILVDRLASLIDNADLRRSLGQSGRERALSLFDWSQVFRRYQDLWRDLDHRRTVALETPAQAAWAAAAPREASDALDPLRVFGGYPTAQVGSATLVTLASADPTADYDLRRAHVLFSGVQAPPAAVTPMLAELVLGPRSVAVLAQRAAIGASACAAIVAALAKMGIVALSAP